MNTVQAMAGPMENSVGARYEQVKEFILRKARSREWKPGDRIPSENELVKVLGVSRMTINRALRELSAEGELVRRGGVGTFMAEPRVSSTLLMIARIGDEIRARGHRYHWSVITKQNETSTPEVARALELTTGANVYHLSCIHFENNTPVQWEDRFVNPACAPCFLDQSFAIQPPSEYLLAVIPAEEIEHTVDAVVAGEGAAMLQIGRKEPCLLLTRRTWAAGAVVTFARLLYPASRYRLQCRFKASAAKGRD
jgi:GntR family histidine utilization transcriptional repressor